MLLMGGKGVSESVQDARLEMVLRAIFVSATYVTNFLSGAFLEVLAPCIVGKGRSIFSDYIIPNDCGVLGKVLLFLVTVPTTLDWLRALATWAIDVSVSEIGLEWEKGDVATPAA